MAFGFYMRLYRRSGILLFLLVVASALTLVTYANCPYCKKKGVNTVCYSCKETLGKIRRTLQGEETEMEINISIPSCTLPGEASLNYPAIKRETRATIASLVSSQPYSIKSDMAEFAIPLVHNLLLTLRPQFPGIQGTPGAGEETILEHTQPALFSITLACRKDFIQLSSLFITGIDNLLQQSVMQGTADSWMTTIHAAFENIPNTVPGSPSFVWITEIDEDEPGWMFIVVNSDESSTLFNWNFHPHEDSVVAITQLSSRRNLIDYIRRMLADNTNRIRSGFY